MASSPLMFRARRLFGSSEVGDHDQRTWLVPAFVIGSLGAHVLAWVVLATLPAGQIDVLLAESTIELELMPLPQPEPEPVPVSAPAPEPERAPLVRAAAEVPPPAAPEPPPPPAAPEPPPLENAGVQSVEDGLLVDAAAAIGDGAGVFVARPVSAGEPGGGGVAVASVPLPSPAHSRVDHRRLAQQWMVEVNRAVMRRAVRDYPRAARRSQLEGTVFVSISVDERGRITDVGVERGAGYETLDRAAVAAVQAVGTLPAPPDIFSRRGRPLTMPISYRLR